MEKKTSITLIKLGAMGDVVLACKALNAIGEQADGVLWNWVIDPIYMDLAKSLLAPKLAPKIHFAAFDSSKLYGSIARRALAALELRQTVAATKPRAIALLYRNSAYRAALAGIAPVFRRRPSGEVHEFDVYLETLRASLRETGRDFSLHAAKAQEQGRSRRIRKIGVLVGGGKNQRTSWPEKRWPKMAELVARLLENDGVEVELFGSSDDAAEAQLILDASPNKSRIKNLVGKLALGELPINIAKLDAFVSVDSGLAQIASLVMTNPGQKVVSLFGPTDPLIWGPQALGEGTVRTVKKELPCSPCYENNGVFPPCKFQGEDFQKCMKLISAQEVASLLGL